MPDAAPDSSRSHRRLELVATLLLAFATLGTAWSAYQAREWTGEQSQGYSRATKNRIAVNRVSAVANRQVQIDVATFVQWVDARGHGDARLASFYRARFRDEFAVAFDAWIALDPLNDPEAPATPFAMEEYVLAARTDAERLEREATATTASAHRDVQQADNYVLCVVLFAASLFFAGISTRLRSAGAQLSILGLGYVVFLGALGWMLTYPVSFAT